MLQRGYTVRLLLLRLRMLVNQPFQRRWHVLLLLLVSWSMHWCLLLLLLDHRGGCLQHLLRWSLLHTQGHGKCHAWIHSMQQRLHLLLLLGRQCWAGVV
jgi:hypothetical protein